MEQSEGSFGASLSKKFLVDKAGCQIVSLYEPVILQGKKVVPRAFRPFGDERLFFILNKF